MEVTCQSSTTCIPWQRTPASINSVSQMVHATSSFHQPHFNGWTKREVYFCNHFLFLHPMGVRDGGGGGYVWEYVCVWIGGEGGSALKVCVSEGTWEIPYNGVWVLSREYTSSCSVYECVSMCACHTPSVAFRHLPPNSARFGYITEGALFISAQLSTDAVSALRKVWVLVRLWKQPSAQART